MSSTILLIVLLSAHITGLSSKQLLKATVGGSVLFPCSLPGYPLTFYWQEGKEHFFQWDDGKITKDPSKYKNRIQFFDDEFSSGNISFRLDNISVEDDQKTFFAYVKLDKQKPSERRCEYMLQVSAPYQHLVLTVNHTTNTATCSARGGYPAAQVSWKGLNRSSDKELDLQDAETSLQRDPTDTTFSFTSSVNVTGLKSVTCIVYNRHSHKTVNRTKKIDAGENARSHAVVGYVVVVVVIVILAGFCRWYKSPSQDPDPTPAKQPPGEIYPQDGAQAEAPDLAQGPEPPNEPPVDPNPQNGALFHRRTRSKGGAARDTDEDAAASPEKKNLLESR